MSEFKKDNVDFQIKRGTYAALSKKNEVYKDGQPIYEKDTRKMKIGNGRDTYKELPYIALPGDNFLSVHDTDNNKYYRIELRVVDGKTRVVLNETALPPGMDGLPKVDQSNNGQFLRVVNGEWKAVDMKQAEETSF